MKIILDASTIINLSENCLLWLLPKIKEKTGWKFLIPNAVKDEIITRPITIKKYELDAIRINKYLVNGTIELSPYNQEAKEKSNQISQLVNEVYKARGKYIQIMHLGENEALGIISATDANALAVDEKNTRFIIEAPEQIRESMERVLKTDVTMDTQKLKEIKKIIGNVKVIRSTELIALASDLGILKIAGTPDEQVLEAALYAARYEGCSISVQEIQDYLVGK